jgi:hypothetical protein
LRARKWGILGWVALMTFLGASSAGAGMLRQVHVSGKIMDFNREVTTLQNASGTIRVPTSLVEPEGLRPGREVVIVLSLDEVLRLNMPTGRPPQGNADRNPATRSQ